MFIYDHLTYDYQASNLWSETTLSSEFSNIASLKGRVVCAWRVCFHSVLIVVKPICYIAVGILFCALEGLTNLNSAEKKISIMKLGVDVIRGGINAPIQEIMLLFKAILGIFHPGFYFKENEFDIYFEQLAEIAETLNCDPSLIELLKKGSSIIAMNSGSKGYYYELFKQDLAVICEKLQGSELSDDEKISVMNLFAPIENEPEKSAIYACAPGFGRLLEQICASLDVPQKIEEIIPWLTAQMKQEILHQLIMHFEENGNYMQMIVGDDNDDLKIDGAHFGNLLIALLGKKIGLPKKMIDIASKDSYLQYIHLSDKDQNEILGLFNQKYNEKVLLSYLTGRINSQPDGKPGLKIFRNAMIQKLSETISEDEIQTSSKAVQEAFKIGEGLAEDPIFHVKFNYFLYPHIHPSDEKASDLNEEGIRAFAITLKDNPFMDFEITHSDVS